MKHHPIQLVDLEIKELGLVVRDPVAAQQDNLEAEIMYQVGSHKFDEDDKVAAVGFKCLINLEKEDAPFTISVHLIGIFTVGDEFPKDKIDHWSQHNAPLILMPYIRENVYAMAMRARIRLYLPLVVVQVPTKSND
jgi:preprotein translocase subunit SecB